MTDVPSFIGAFCEPNKLKIDWVNCFCVPSDSYFCNTKPTKSRTQTNLFSKRTSRRHGQAQVNVLTWPTRCLTEGRDGASLRSATVFRNRILSACNPPKLQGGSNRIPKNTLIPAQKNDPKSARLNYVPAQIWKRQAPTFHPIEKQKNITNTCPHSMGISNYSIQTHTQLPAKTWKLTFKNVKVCHQDSVITHDARPRPQPRFIGHGGA